MQGIGKFEEPRENVIAEVESALLGVGKALEVIFERVRFDGGEAFLEELGGLFELLRGRVSCCQKRSAFVILVLLNMRLTSTLRSSSCVCPCESLAFDSTCPILGCRGMMAVRRCSKAYDNQREYGVVAVVPGPAPYDAHDRPASDP